MFQQNFKTRFKFVCGFKVPLMNMWACYDRSTNYTWLLTKWTREEKINRTPNFKLRSKHCAKVANLFE
jgi:hypothetical protein